MIVIADSGSTKTDWCIGNSQTDYRIVQTPGINPFYLSTKEISRQITENLFPQLTEKDTVTELYFYGAGCTPMLRWKVTCREPPAPCADIRKALPVYWEQDRIPASTTVKKLFPMFLHWGTYWGTKEAEPCWVNAWWVTASKNSFPPTCANCC